MELKLFNEAGECIGSWDIGISEGEWNVLCDDEANQLIADMQRKIEEHHDATL